MKVLLYDSTNAYLTPGGKTTHALKLQKEISAKGVDIEFARWWDSGQKDCDIIHFLHPNPLMARQARERGIKTFCSLIFDYESSKTKFQQFIAKRKLFLRRLTSPADSLFWTALNYMDKVHFMHQYDRDTALSYFPDLLKPKNTVIIPHAYDPGDMHLGLKEVNFTLPSKYLVSVANISPRKQTLLLATYAKAAKVPVVFLGGHVDTDPYYQNFLKEVDNKYVYYPGFVSKEEKDYILDHASGYVLLSLGESGCIAVYEAAAYKMPILLSNLPWAWGYEEPQNIEFCNFQSKDKAISEIKMFFDHAGKLDHTPYAIHTWGEAASMYIEQYNQLMTE